MFGVFFSANDRVYDWVISFLESFREFNPDLPLRLIPFNKECDRINRLADVYRFEIHSDVYFPILEDLGRSLELGITPTGPHWFRRFASFWGPFDTFFYLDARTLVLSDLSAILSKLESSRFDLLHYDCALDQVYNPGLFRDSLLREGKGRGFNSGRWAAKKGIFGIDDLVAFGNECLAIREHLNARNTDQFFLNYCCDFGGKRVANMADVMGGMCSSGWCRQSGYVYRDASGFRRWDHGGSDHKKIVPLIHWAGIPLSSSMPEAELFFSFRDRCFAVPHRVLRRLNRMVPRLVGRGLSGLRRNRAVNTVWHRLRGG